MAGKTSKTAANAKREDEKFPRKAIPHRLAKGDTEEMAWRKFAGLATSPELAAYRVIAASEHKTAIGNEIDVPTMLEELHGHAMAVNRGELSQAEAMLINQASALQTLFARLAERGMGCDHAPAFEANMRMALRAQSQCRATLETLATIKNPPVVFAKQANIAHGPQQVNNGIPASTQAREIKSEQTQLSGDTNELRQVGGASPLTGRINKAVEALGKIDRSQVEGGKS